MIIAGAESMGDVLLDHFKKAGRPFEINDGATVSVPNAQGDELHLHRSPGLIEVLQDERVDAILCGDDILLERSLQFRDHRQSGSSPYVYQIAEYTRYGRSMVTPTLDLVVTDEKKQGLGWIEPGQIIVTEHPYILKELLRRARIKFVRIGEGYRNVPMLHNQFREWGEEYGVVGIKVIKGKAPSYLIEGQADAATMVNETGKTLRENRLFVAHNILPGIHTLLLVASDAKIENEWEKVWSLKEDLDIGYKLMLKAHPEGEFAGAERK